MGKNIYNLPHRPSIDQIKIDEKLYPQGLFILNNFSFTLRVLEKINISI